MQPRQIKKHIFVYRIVLLIYHHGTIHEGLRFFMILLNLRKFQSLPCNFLFLHLYFTEHLFCAGQILLFFSLLLWARHKSNTKPDLSFFLYHTLAVCPPLITFHPPVHKLNASRTKTGIQGELGATWSSPVPSVNGCASVCLPLSGSFNHHECHYIVILQSVFSGLLPMTLGAAEIKSFSCRVLAVAITE